MTKIGCHISSAGKIWKVFERAEKIGANCLQTFIGSPQSWAQASYSDDDLDHFILRHQQSDIDPIFIHSQYLINLASVDDRIRQGSIRLLIHDLEMAEKLGVCGVVTHIGSSGDQELIVSLEKVKDSLGIVLQSFPNGLKTKLYLENAAGAGKIIGASISELSDIIRSIDYDKRVGICLDTCHAYVSGYDLRDRETISRLAKEIDQMIGWSRLGLVHANDSKGALGSKLDRHEVIGRGHLGLNVFEQLLKHPDFSKIPFILETPDLKVSLDEPPESLLALQSLI